SARDARVDELDAAISELLVKPHGRARRGGAQVDDDLPGAGTLEDSAGAEDDSLDNGAVREREKDDVRVGDELRDRGGGLDAGALELRSIPVVTGQLPARVENSAGDPAAHVSD